jgi:hypothetical protein
MPILYGITNNISNNSVNDGVSVAALQGKSGEIIDSALHGKYYTSNYRNRLFSTGVLIAGVTIPVNTTTAPTFTLFNPPQSGVNLELCSLDVGWPAAATTVVATLLGTTGVQTPTSVTAGNIYACAIGGAGASVAKFYTAATIVAITQHLPLLQVTSTTDQMTASHYDFDGRMILTPGSLFTLTSSPVQTGVAMPALTWAEFPI